MQKIKVTGIAVLLGISMSVFGQATNNDISKDTIAERSFFVEKIENVVAWYMDNINYGTVMLLMGVESSCFIPFPSEVVVPPAAYKACQEDSNLNIILIIVFATIGALMGSLVNYFLALWLGRPIIYKFAESKLGRMCLLSSEKIQKAENYFVKHGKITTFICRLVPGIRQVISIPAGLSQMPLLSFISYTLLGAGIWNVILAVMGYIAHGQADKITQYNKEISIAILVLGGLFVLYLLYNGFVKKRKKKK